MNSELTREWRKWHNISVYETGRPPVLARAAATPGPAGTAETTLTITQPAPAQPVTITARAAGQACQARLTPTRTQPALTCHTTR